MKHSEGGVVAMEMEGLVDCSYLVETTLRKCVLKTYEKEYFINKLEKYGIHCLNIHINQVRGRKQFADDSCIKSIPN